MKPFLEAYRPEIIAMGGNISNAGHLFIPKFRESIEAYTGSPISIEVSILIEDAAIIGSAKLFNPIF